MSIGFQNPEPNYSVNYTQDIRDLDNLFNQRGVPVSQNNRLLLVTWNIANLGAQKRTDNEFKVIAHLLKRFDLAALQEINENFSALLRVLHFMGDEFDYIMTDTAGNTERLCYIYRNSKIELRNLIGEIALNKNQYPKLDVNVRYRENRQWTSKIYEKFKFVPFDRNPFIASFKAGSLDFTIANVHLYFGCKQNSKKEADHLKYCRRVLEIYALSKWCHSKTRKSKNKAYDKDIILLGDMNIPEMDKKESTYKALVRYGLKPVEFFTKCGGSNIANNKTYDQVGFAPGTIKNRIVNYDVFDFDNGIMRAKWDQILLQKNGNMKKATSQFNKYVKNRYSDHRPIWVQLKTD